MLVRLFRIKQVKAPQKSLAGAFYKGENGETEKKRVFDNLRMPKLLEIFTTVATVCHCYERLEYLKNVFEIIPCFVQVKALKRFSENLYQ